jgi:RNA polymerase subunit RPABC4/transcription elongation factor Spt4
MIHCQNCGNENEYNVNFCRFCGNRIIEAQSQHIIQQDSGQRRPYLWKTDELQINPVNQQTEQIAHVQLITTKATQQLEYQKPSFVTSGYRCPRCGTQNLPVTKRQISTAGWITFAVLLVTTGIFFWIGLLIKEDARICPVCNCKLN